MSISEMLIIRHDFTAVTFMQILNFKSVSGMLFSRYKSFRKVSGIQGPSKAGDFSARTFYAVSYIVL